MSSNTPPSGLPQPPPLPPGSYGPNNSFAALHKFYEAKTYDDLMSTMFDMFPALEAPMALRTWFRVIFGIGYALIFFVGIPINLGVAWLTYKRKCIDIITKMHFLNLLLANIMLIAVTIPWVPISTMRITWPFSATACVTLPALQGLAACVTTFQLAVLALRRALGIMYRSNNRINILIHILIIIFIWACATVLMAPYGVFTKYTKHENRFYMIYFGIAGGTFCSEDWPNSSTTATYRVSIFLVHFILPVLALIAMLVYLRIEEKQRQLGLMHNEELPSNTVAATVVPALQQQQVVNGGNVVAMEPHTHQHHHHHPHSMADTFLFASKLIVCVLLLHLMWAPLDILNILMDTDEVIQGWKHLLTLAVVFHLLGLATVILSPFLLQLLSTDINVQRELRALVPVRFSNLARRQAATATTNDFQHSSIGGHMNGGAVMSANGSGVGSHTTRAYSHMTNEFNS